MLNAPTDPRDVGTVLARLRGKFIVLDGPDGAGKSTQQNKLGAVLTEAGIPFVWCRDPGGTEIGDRIRTILLGYDLSQMDVNCETMLFMASRAQLLKEIIRPALSAGKTVLCDRYVSSTCAYQGAAGYDPRRVIELARFALSNGRELWPDVTVILDVEPELGFRRTGRTARDAGKNFAPSGGQLDFLPSSSVDAMEARPLEFHRKVRKLFLELPSFYPTPVVVVDAARDVETVHRDVLEAIGRVLS